MQLLYDLAKQYDYERYVCALFASSKIRLKLIVVIALCGEISRIPNISSEEMVVLVRLKWWSERLNNLQDCVSAPPLLQLSREILQNNPQLLHEILNFCEIVVENCHDNSHKSIQNIMRQYFKLLSIAAGQPDYELEYLSLADYFSGVALIRTTANEMIQPPALPNNINVSGFIKKLNQVANLWDKQLSKKPVKLKINHLAYKLLLQSFTFYLPK